MLLQLLFSQLVAINHFWNGFDAMTTTVAATTLVHEPFMCTFASKSICHGIRCQSNLRQIVELRSRCHWYTGKHYAMQQQQQKQMVFGSCLLFQYISGGIVSFDVVCTLPILFFFIRFCCCCFVLFVAPTICLHIHKLQTCLLFASFRKWLACSSRYSLIYLCYRLMNTLWETGKTIGVLMVSWKKEKLQTRNQRNWKPLVSIYFMKMNAQIAHAVRKGPKLMIT